jgi:hypothetical protein
MHIVPCSSHRNDVIRIGCISTLLRDRLQRLDKNTSDEGVCRSDIFLVIPGSRNRQNVNQDSIATVKNCWR